MGDKESIVRSSDKEFVGHLRAEKLQAEEARSEYTSKKLAYATAILGIGSLGLTNIQIDLSALLYAVPWIALAFDFYILAEDYSVKRIGAFLGANSGEDLERRWENWVSRFRDPFAPFAMPLLTTVFLVAALFVLLLGGTNTLFLGLWFFFTLVIVWLLFFGYRGLLKRVKTDLAQAAVEESPLINQIQHTVDAVVKANHVLDENVYSSVKDLFLACDSNLNQLNNLKSLAPEYGTPEYLLCVDSLGQAVSPISKVIEDIQETAVTYPEIANWFQLMDSSKDNQKVILVARWLCHLIGIRHQVVHLFIEHPSMENVALVQIRGLGKFEAPGLFDLPVAGHVKDLEEPELSLLQELKEEVNLNPGDYDALEKVDEYTFGESDASVRIINYEYRTIFGCRLNDNGLLKMKPAPEEVLAISMLTLSELQHLTTNRPEIAASALRESFPKYLRVMATEFLAQAKSE